MKGMRALIFVLIVAMMVVAIVIAAGTAGAFAYRDVPGDSPSNPGGPAGGFVMRLVPGDSPSNPGGPIEPPLPFQVLPGAILLLVV